MTPILALIGAAVLAAAGVFTYFGSYWYQYLKQVRSPEVKPTRTTDDFRSADDE